MKVADIDTVPSVRRAEVKVLDETATEFANKAIDGRFAKAYEIWCAGGTMAYAARASGCSYSSFRYWIRKDRRQRIERT